MNSENGTNVIFKALAIKILTAHEAHTKKIESKAEQRKTDAAEKLTCTNAIYWIIDWPAQKILYMTCLPVTKEEYNTNRILLWAIFGPMTVILLASQSTAWQVYLMVGMPICVLFMLTFLCSLKKRDPPTWFWVFTLLGVAIALLYLYVLIAVLVDFLNALGMVFNLK
jgi:lipid-A-disaccharide synthase-like uncharacterized protein